MRSLFLRIFLWFWLAMALVIVALFVATELTRSGSTFWPGARLDTYTIFIAQTAVSIYEREGQPGLVSFLERMERETDVKAGLFDGQGTDLSGRNTRPNLQAMAKRSASAGGPVRSGRHAPGHLVSFPALTDSRGNHYVFVIELGPSAAPPASSPWSLVPSIFAALVTAGLVCYLLARYIASPVVKLRAVTRQVAGGNLSARVVPLLGNRNDELAALGQDFDLMAARIESLVEAQRRLLSDISHELRSPLARQGVALGLARRRAGPEVKTALDRIALESKRLDEMIGQLLTLSRDESGMEGVPDVKVDLGALVQEIAGDADFEARARDRSVRVVRCESSITNGVPQLLGSAIENVVRNGVHYTFLGTEVEVSLTSEVVKGCRYAVVKVRDHGSGVPDEAIDEIFRPFYRVEDARDRKTGGSGLGLAIASRAVRLHGGTIKAENAKGGGLVVEIKFRIKEYHEDSSDRDQE